MAKKVRYIPTLQDYVKKRKRERAYFLELKSCLECDYYRRDTEVCLWGDTVRGITTLKTCPVTFRDLE